MRLSQITWRIVMAMAIVFAMPGCATDVHGLEPASVDTVKTGGWGGQHNAMTVASGGASIEFDCGKATVSSALTTDRDGAFPVTGTFQPERPGPTTPEGLPQRPM